MKEFHVKKILKKWFKNRGYEVLDPDDNIQTSPEIRVDLIAKKDDEHWIIETKGDYDRKAAQYNVNFDTGMGQLLKSITALNNKTKYAICIPFSRTERGEKLSYRRILKKYSKSIIFEELNIYIILVRDDESVELIPPKDVRPFLSAIDPNIKIR